MRVKTPPLNGVVTPCKVLLKAHWLKHSNLSDNEERLPQVEALDLPQSLSGYFIRQAGFCQIMRDYVGTQTRQFYLWKTRVRSNQVK